MNMFILTNIVKILLIMKCRYLKDISPRSFFKYDFRRMVISICNIFIQVIIWLINSPSLYQLQPSKGWCTRLRCKSLDWWFALGGVYTRCTLFPSQGFVPLGFPCKVFNEATSMCVLLRDVYSFSFTRFFPTGFFLVRF